jgi:hypothetical protein
MHLPINVKSPNNIIIWQMGFNSTFKGLMLLYILLLIYLTIYLFNTIILRKMLGLVNNELDRIKFG